MNSFARVTLKLLLLLTVFGLVSIARAQQPDETLPGFRPQNVLEAHAIDNVNLFNGDPGIVIPLGPSYPLGPGFSWQINAHGTSKYWHFDDACSGDVPVQNAFISGHSTIGIGWILELGFVSTGGVYHAPDGSFHSAAIAQPNMQGITVDNSRLRVTRNASNDQNATQYTVEFPDGIIQTFAYKYTTPTAQSGSCSGPDGGYCSPDFVDTGYNETALYYFGLTKIADQFGNTLLTVDYGNGTAAPAWGVAHAYLRGNTSPATTITFNWGTTQVMNSANGNPTWWTLSSIDFATLAGKTLNVAFAYKNSQSGQFASFRRNTFDNSDSAGICATPATVAVPFLDTVTYSGTGFTSFQYAFDYFFADPSLSPNQDGAIDQITLPTGGTISYTYARTIGQNGEGWCVGIVGQTCDDPETGIHANPLADEPEIGPIGYFRSFLDSSAAVVARSESGNTTTYYRYTQTPGSMQYPDITRITRRVIVTRPDGNGGSLVTKYIFHVANYDGSFPVAEDGGIEIARRYYQSGADGSGDPFRTIINCHTGGDTDGTPICGYRDSSGNIQAYFLTTNVRPTRHVTWYGVNPTGGGACSQATTPCVQSVNSGYDSTARKYQTTTLTNTHLVLGGATRTITTTWAANADSTHWLLNLFGEQDATEGTTIQNHAEFDNDNGFLKGFATYDSARQIEKWSCSYEDANGNVADDFSATSTASVFYQTPCSQFYPSYPDVIGTNSDAFGHVYTWQNGLLKTAKWVNGASGGVPIVLPWYTFNTVRDAATGLITSSSDTAGQTTTYAYDALGRITAIDPPGTETATAIAYDSTTQTTVSRSGGSWERYLYDDRGRISREIRQMPANYAVRIHSYDSADHEYFTSEWKSCTSATSDCKTVTALGTTLSSFDPFGRARHIAKADATTSDIDRTDVGTTPNISFSETLEKVTVNNVGGHAAATYTRKDDQGRVVSVKESTGVSTCNYTSNCEETQYAYDVNGKLTSVTHVGSTQAARTFVSDAFGFLRQENAPEKSHLSGSTVVMDPVYYTSYGSLGNLREKQEGNASLGDAVTLDYTYDPAGRLAAECSGVSSDLLCVSSTSQIYLTNTYDTSCPSTPNNCGRLTQQTAWNYIPYAAAPVTKTFTYAGLGGRLSALNTAIGNGDFGSPTTQTWTYNNLGLVSQYVTPRSSGSGITIAPTYTVGLPTSMTASGQTIVSASPAATYNPSGGLASWKAGNGVTTTIAQDSTLMPRPGRISTTGASANFDSGSYTYDGAGDITAMTVDANNSEAFTYDVRARLTQASYEVGGATSTQAFSYDRFGSLTGVTGTGGRTLTTNAGNNHLSSGTYDTRGNLTAYGTESLTYDSLNRQTRENAALAYVYDGGGERQAKIPVFNNVLRRELARYAVEANLQVPGTGWHLGASCAGIFVDVPMGDSDCKYIELLYNEGVTAGCDGTHFCPDNTSTRQQMVIYLVKAHHCEFNVGACSYAPPPANCATFPFVDVTCPSVFANYDAQAVADGVTVGCDSTHFCPNSLVNEWQMLAFLQAGSYTDWLSYRPIPRGTSFTYRDEQNRIVTEAASSSLAGSGSATPSFNRDNVFFGNLLVAAKDSTAGWQYYASDHLGTPRLATDGSAVRIEARTFWPYGDQFSVTGGDAGQKLKFAAMENDPEANHYYDHARTHDFNLGRFVSVDKNAGRSLHPMTWNRYSYALGNPLKLLDPDGRAAVGFTGFGNAGDSGVVRIIRDINGARNIGEARVFRHQDVGAAVKFLAAQHKANPSEAIVLTGHSLGAASAVDAAKQLGQQGIKVNLVVTIDPVFSDKKVSANVEKAVNYYETASSLGGRQLTAESSNTSVDNVDVQGVTHTSIDNVLGDSGAVAGQIQETALQGSGCSSAQFIGPCQPMQSTYPGGPRTY
jgi:RHS repeat-associated protein